MILHIISFAAVIIGASITIAIVAMSGTTRSALTMGALTLLLLAITVSNFFSDWRVKRFWKKTRTR